MLGYGSYATQDRRIRRGAVKKAAHSSRVSLLSATTATSSGSSGSGSTITQESLSRPRVRNMKGDLASKGKRQRTVAEGKATKGKTLPRKGKGEIDVFAFLDKDQSRASLVEKRTKNKPVTQQDQFSPHDESDLDSDPRSFHSDSGISINDSTVGSFNDVGSDHDPSKLNRALGTRLGTLEEEQGPAQYQPSLTEQSQHPSNEPISQELDEDHPEWYYWGGSQPGEIASAPGMEIDPESENTESKPSGYDLLATYLCSLQDPSEATLPPIYRRFARLNHRILLQLQDEIAEMEEDLELMDRADARERAARHGRAAPASRRRDWQWRGSELHARRLELLGRIYLKVEQYNQALSSFQRVNSSTSPAMIADIETYRKWMAKHQPVAQSEATYLDKANDLLNLNQRRIENSLQTIHTTTNNTTTTTPTQLTALMMSMTAATALPMLLFRILSGFTSRITVILLLLPPLAFLPLPIPTPKSHSPITTLLPGMEAWHFLFVYFGMLILAALVI